MIEQAFDEHWMHRALELASAAATADEVPVGAIILNDKFQVIAAAHNQRQQLRDPTAHAEMIAITQAAESIGDWRLEGCTLYVTLEPCPMCAGAILQSRVPRVVYGADDPKAGAVTSLYQLLTDTRLNHTCEIVSGVLEQQCASILTDFFAAKRALGKK
ncbi:MAG: tRNA adenosine(34) deaminase TadA [Pirellulaceae bacterium]